MQHAVQEYRQCIMVHIGGVKRGSTVGALIAVMHPNGHSWGWHGWGCFGAAGVSGHYLPLWR
jgi:hypothetical protein